MEQVEQGTAERSEVDPFGSLNDYDGHDRQRAHAGSLPQAALLGNGFLGSIGDFRAFR